MLCYHINLWPNASLTNVSFSPSGFPYNQQQCFILVDITTAFLWRQRATSPRPSCGPAPVPPFLGWKPCPAVRVTTAAPRTGPTSGCCFRAVERNPTEHSWTEHCIIFQVLFPYYFFYNYEIYVCKPSFDQKKISFLLWITMTTQIFVLNEYFYLHD